MKFGRWATGGNQTSHRPRGHLRRTVRAPAEAVLILSRTTLSYQEMIMVRRSTSSTRARLSVTQLEARDVPAGIVALEAVNLHEVGRSFLYLTGDNHDNHVRVELPTPNQIVVSSDTGLLRYYDDLQGAYVLTAEPLVFVTNVMFHYPLECIVQTGYGDDAVQVSGGFFELLQIDTDNGNDRVDVGIWGQDLRVNTGNGNDSVVLQNCGVTDVPFTGPLDAALILTGSGDDRLALMGVNRFNYLQAFLEQGNDVLAGDATVGSSLSCEAGMLLNGGTGDDRLIAADYFTASLPPIVYLDGFEEVD